MSIHTSQLTFAAALLALASAVMAHDHTHEATAQDEPPSKEQPQSRDGVSKEEKKRGEAINEEVEEGWERKLEQSDKENRR